MNHYFDQNRPPSPELATLFGALIAIALIAVLSAFRASPLYDEAGGSAATPISAQSLETVAPEPTQIFGDSTAEATSTPDVTPTASSTPSPTPTVPTSTPTHTPAPTVTPTPTLDLGSCNAAGCGAEAAPLPSLEYDPDLLLRTETPVRRNCEECPVNERLSEAELDALIGADQETLERLQTLALSQETHEIAPGIVYIAYDYVHHVVIDLNASGYILRNIIPDNGERGTLITPSYCLSPESLVVIDADYHGLNGSNKTETGRDLFFHLGRAALFQRDGRFDIDVIRTREDYEPVTISWGGGPIFIWDGQYDFDPEQEWFDAESLEYYRETRWAKMSVAVSEDRKYLFISASFDLTLEEHAENIINLGKAWGIDVDRAMRFDGGESAYLALRLGDYLVPVLDLEEPLIVNCLAIERDN